MAALTSYFLVSAMSVIRRKDKMCHIVLQLALIVFFNLPWFKLNVDIFYVVKEWKWQYETPFQCIKDRKPQAGVDA